MNAKAEQVVKDIREVTDVPCVISYGIASMDSVKKMSELSDGVVASEDIMLLLAEHKNSAAPKIGELIAEIKNNQNK